LPQRPDLKVIITSATIDSERFAEHFGAPGRPAPVIEVSGRTYPVEVRYRPLVPDADDDEPEDRSGGAPRGAHASAAREAQLDQATASCRAADELMAEGPGDILLFCSGERQIRDAGEALEKHLAGGPGPPVELLPLYARLSAA